MEKALAAIFAACVLLSCLDGWAVRGEGDSGDGERRTAAKVSFLRSQRVAEWFDDSARDALLAAQLALRDLATAGGDSSPDLELVSGLEIVCRLTFPTMKPWAKFGEVNTNSAGCKCP